MKYPVIAIDFFCGAGGLTRGLMNAGIKVLGGVDNDPRLKATYEHNNRPSQFICEDIKSVNIIYLLKKLGANARCPLLYTACTPCQPFSSLNRSKKRDMRESLLLQFGKLVLSHPPDYILVENVPGINGNMNALSQSRNIMSVFQKQLKEAGFDYIVSKLINAADYGVPQERKRFILVASRHGEMKLPRQTTKLNPLTVREAISRFLKPKSATGNFPKLPNHNYRPLQPHHLQIIRAVPQDGGSRRDVKNTSLLLKCHQGRPYHHRDVFGRMYWDRPAPTLTARCTDVYCGRFTHPTANRGITLREAAAIQTFADDYEFFGTFHHCAKQIGNAVPVELAQRLGESIIIHNREIQP